MIVRYSLYMVHAHSDRCCISQILISVVISGMLYFVTFLKIRGNLKLVGWKIEFHQVADSSDKGDLDDRTAKVAKQMLL